MPGNRQRGNAGGQTARGRSDKGRNVLIEKSYGAPVVTKDGVTLVREIEF
jgi:hypothetical protein